jgi:Tol biopolymer transport system component
VQIADTDGRVLASFAALRDDATWSPDSKRLQGWMSWGGATQIGIYGIDGVLEATISVPDGYSRWAESGGVWASDGRSVLVRIAQPRGRPEGWWLPVDGSAASRLANGDPLTVSFTRSGDRMAFTSDLTGAGASLYVANADGTDAVVVPTSASAIRPIWSPDGTRMAYLDGGSGDGYRIRVVDLLSGSDRELRSGPRPRRVVIARLVTGQRQGHVADT